MIERILVTIKGGKIEGWVEGKDIMAIEIFLVIIAMWRLKGFWSPQLCGE
jgi:hypothetical protein